MSYLTSRERRRMLRDKTRDTEISESMPTDMQIRTPDRPLSRSDWMGAILGRTTGDTTTSSTGDISFPILYTEEDIGSVGDATINIDLSIAEAHFQKLTLTGDISLSFTNLPSSGKIIFFLLNITQDNVGEHAVTFPTNVITAPDLDTTPSTTTILTGFATSTSIILTNFGSRITNIFENPGGDVSQWATHAAVDAIDASGNAVNNLGGITFSQFAGVSTSIIPHTDRLEILAGNNRKIQLKEDASTILAEFSNTNILFEKTIQNSALTATSVLIADVDKNIVSAAVSSASLLNAIHDYPVGDSVDTRLIELEAHKIVNLSDVDDVNSYSATHDNNVLTLINDNWQPQKIINAYIADAAGIAFSKMEALTTFKALISDTNGRVFPSSVSSTSLLNALHDYPVGDSVDSRLSSLEADEASVTNLPDDIPFSKMEALTTFKVLISDTNGIVFASAVSSASLLNALNNYPVGDTVDTRLSALETGSNFNPNSISGNLLPQDNDDTDQRIGSSTNVWNRAYISDVLVDEILPLDAETGITIGNSSTKIGFFGTDPSSQQVVTTLSNINTATTSAIAGRLNQLILSLKEYGIV